MNPQQRLEDGFNQLKDATQQIKQNAEDDLEREVDRQVGRLMYHHIATIFIWDEEVQAQVFGGLTCPRCGRTTREKYDDCHRCNDELGEDAEYQAGIVELAKQDDMEEAIERGEILQAYIQSMAANNRVYKKHLSKVNDALRGRADQITSSLSGLSGDKLLDSINERIAEVRSDG